MRYSKDHRRQTHIKITETAAIKFRENGIDGTGVAKLMQSLGLTHGGFYAHFSSKDALIEESVDLAFDQTLRSLRKYAEEAEAGCRLARLVDAYVSSVHRDEPGLGCFAAAIASELGRQSEGVRGRVAKRLSDFTSLLVDIARQDGNEVNAQALLAMMVGSLALSRIPMHPSTSQAYLDAARTALPKLSTPVANSEDPRLR